MAIGKKSKDGVIVKSSSGFNYYHSMNDDGLKPLYNPTKTSGPGRKPSKIKTLKVYSMVEFANNQISVKIYPDGRIEIEPSV
jgi:hypothetical protein